MWSGRGTKESEVSPGTLDTFRKGKLAQKRLGKRGKDVRGMLHASSTQSGLDQKAQQDRDTIVLAQQRARAVLQLQDIKKGLQVADEAAHHVGRHFPSESEVDFARRYLGRRTC
jgi:hypothetical protein